MTLGEGRQQRKTRHAFWSGGRSRFVRPWASSPSPLRSSRSWRSARLGPGAGIALSLAPALGLIAILFGTSVVYGVSQSLGYLPFLQQETVSLQSYRAVLLDTRYATQFWHGLVFSLYVSSASTVLAAACALLVMLLWGERLRTASSGTRRLTTAINVHLSFPHLVWAVGLSLLLAQSGVLARVATLLGLMDAPANFPIVIRDRWGIGIILHYATKETPFLLLVMLGSLQSQPTAYQVVAENLGATRWQRLRYITLPMVLPSLLAGSLLVFAFVFGAYEVPAVLGVRFPEMLSVVALDFFLDPDLHSRAEGMAISVIMAVVVLVVAGLARRLARREAGR
ncbi:MAG TPA: ABC transporter permease subunit [Herpetosiphonaceae bacterium]|nr:ABC transporter permease subunit [Herpetosiphonaceae bacterium]